MCYVVFCPTILNCMHVCLFMWIPCLWVHSHSLFQHSLANLKKKHFTSAPGYIYNIYAYISTLEKSRSTNSLCVYIFLLLLFPVFSFYTTDSRATIIFNTIFIFTFFLLDFSHFKSSFLLRMRLLTVFKLPLLLLLMIIMLYTITNYHSKCMNFCTVAILSLVCFFLFIIWRRIYIHLTTTYNLYAHWHMH